jgi:hypothetical protein
VSKILDQRDIHGAFTVDGQRDHWVRFLRDSRGGLAPIIDKRTIVAYVSDGRWVADCPHCNDGIACWDENPQGCCLGCGHVYRVRFPDGHKEAEIILTARPMQRNRNWHPHRGETLDHLRDENFIWPAHEQAARKFRETGAVPARSKRRAIGA